MSELTIDKQCTCLLDITTKQCHRCRNEAGIFTCHGCCRHFCPDHVVEHRTILAATLNALILGNQRLATTMNTGHRQQETDQLNQLIKCRDRFAVRLQEAKTTDNYHDRHLKYWQQFLEDLQENFARLQTGQVSPESPGSYAANLAINDKPVKIRFSKWCEYKETCLQVADLRRTGEYRDGDCTEPIVVKSCTDAAQRPRSPSSIYLRPRSPSPPIPTPRRRSPSPIYARPSPIQRYSSQRSSDQSESDEYRFTLAEGDEFIGIISKREEIIDAPLNTPSVYGWSISENAIYRNGRRRAGVSNDLRPGDVVMLNLYSDDKKIRLTNLTRFKVHELSVSLEKCPLPWTVHMVLSDINSF